jgi:hypothetical protein
VSKFLRSINSMGICTLAAVLIAAGWSPVAQAATKKVKCGKDDLQKVITAAVSGDTIELTGICLGNYRIDGKDLTLAGAATAGPHGIQGVATDVAGLVISRSNNTVLQNLSFSDGAFWGVRAEYSFFTMSNCTVSRNDHNGVNVAFSSRLDGDHLLFEGNEQNALVAGRSSYADCLECDFNGNLGFAAASSGGSVVTLLESVVTGRSGISANNHSYIDIDCESFPLPPPEVPTNHACSLHVNEIAGRAVTESTVAFYGAGDFWGQIQASDRSEAQVLGARQLSTGVVRDDSHPVPPGPNSNPRSNEISGGSSLRMEGWDTEELSSRLMGITNVREFSHALLYADSAGGDSALVGDLNCGSGGDAWVDAGVDLTAGSINFCEHAAP